MIPWKAQAEILSIQSDISSKLNHIKLNVNYILFFKDLFSGHSAGDKLEEWGLEF